MKTIKYLSIFLIIFLSACQGIKKEPGKSKAIKKDNLTHFESDMKEVYYLLPSPDELLEIVSETGMQYNKQLTNPASRYLDYTTQTAIRINMGIYIADMAYNSLFDQPENLLEYIEVLNSMSRNIYLSESLKSNLKNLTAKEYLLSDSISRISTKLFYEVIYDLESTEQQKTVSLISVGAYIESLFLSLNSVQEYSENDILNRKLAEQQYAFQNLLAYLNGYDFDDEVASLTKKLGTIDSLYRSMKYDKIETHAVYSSDSNLTFTGGKVFSLDEKTFYLLLAEVDRIREDFVNMN